MKLSPRKINTFLLFKLPAAFFTGVRVKSISKSSCTTTVTHSWINQNPFKSMFWAVQGMAAELSTGALLQSKIKGSGTQISMLIASNSGSFSKKARGKITFQCTEGLLIDEAIKNAIASGEGQLVLLQSEGMDSAGDVVSIFKFEWTIKVKQNRR